MLDYIYLNFPVNMESLAVSNSSELGNATYVFPQIGESNELNFSTNKTALEWNNDLQKRIDYFFHEPHFIIDLILGLSTLLANVLSIAAISHLKRTMTTHIRLIVSLNAADLLVSISVLVHLTNKLLNPVIPPHIYTPEQRLGPACMIAFVFALHQMATQISILNVMVMAVDHYLAVIKPLAYLTNSSKRQWLCIIMTIWLVSFCGGFSGFLSGFNIYHKTWMYLNYCECITTFGDYHPEYCTWFMGIMAAMTISFIYIRICYEVCHVNSQMSNIRQGYIKNQKAIQTTLLIIVTFIICWLPTCFFQVVMVIQVYADKKVIENMITSYFQLNKYLNHLYLLNSLMDPLIYAFRLREIQLGYRRLFLRCTNYSGFCRKGSKRYTSSFRYHKDFTSMTSTPDRGYLVNQPDSCMTRQESYRLLFPGRLSSKTPDLHRALSESRSLQDQMILLQEINNQRNSSKTVRCTCSYKQPTVDQGTSQGTNQSRSCVCLPSSEIGLAYKNRYSPKDSAPKSFRFPKARLPARKSSCGSTENNHKKWCLCTTSV